MTIREIAVIGVGVMGQPMAMNILENGFSLTVCDLSEAALEPFFGLDVRYTHKAADCADCDVVVVLVATPDQARSVLLGEGGVVSGLSSRKPLILVMSTISPETMKSIAADLRLHGVRIVDAPVSGGVIKARDGTLAIMMGGDRDDCDALRPLMEAVGDEIFYCGDLGAGQATKIVNNIVGISMLMITAESYRIGLDNGLSLPDAIPVFEAGTGRNYLTGRQNAPSESYAAWAATRADFDSLQAILRKDIDLALSIGKGSGPLPVTHALRAILEGVGDETFENWRAIAATDPTKS